jgi:hypothetical protein
MYNVSNEALILNKSTSVLNFKQRLKRPKVRIQDKKLVLLRNSLRTETETGHTHILQGKIVLAVSTAY